MYAIKKNSTQQINKAEAEACPVNYTLNKIGGRWKSLILYQLIGETKRYNTLKKSIPNISEKMLIQNLKELEGEGLLIREVKPVVPPHVSYTLSAAGKALEPIFLSMAEWGLKHRNETT